MILAVAERNDDGDALARHAGARRPTSAGAHLHQLEFQLAHERRRLAGAYIDAADCVARQVSREARKDNEENKQRKKTGCQVLNNLQKVEKISSTK